MNIKYRHILSLVLVLMLASCSDSFDSILGGDGEIEKGEKVLFTTMVPDVPSTTRSAYTDWKNQVDAYKPVNREYTFDITMYQKDVQAALGNAHYVPDESNLVQNAPTSSYDGTLQIKDASNALYWPDTHTEYGFKATTVSSDAIEADQGTQANWLRQDKLIGYSYLPIWIDDNDDDDDDREGHAADAFDQINYRTAKQWYQDNQTAKQLSGLMVEGESKEAFKKIPLYMKHQRSWITIILKAGDGVTREQLAYENTAGTIKTTIYSYTGEDTQFAITDTWRNPATVDYDRDKNGPEVSNASTTRYDAIVNPYSYYGQNDGNNLIASIDLSNQKFSFAAANDFKYEAAKNSSHADHEAATAHMNGYNLEPGKHLTITATLSRASRLVLITAWVEDWTETVTTTICDDYGQKGDPVVISTKQKLVEFLQGEKNKPGYVGIISANTLNLDEGDEWVTQYALNATLNVAGATLKTTKRLFTDITSSGSLLNGIIEVQDNCTADEFIAETNNGTIEYITLKTATPNSNSKATVAGFVKDNHGTIYQCSSNVNVEGTAGVVFVGGIAATSVYADQQSRTVMPVIDRCTINARVDGADGVKGGGIVGQAEGLVTNCTNVYGITLEQSLKTVDGDKKAFNNIFQTASSDTKAYNNSWPSTATNPVPVNNPDDTQKNTNISSVQYDQVIDCQSELNTLLNSQYNIEGKKYRIAADFTVTVTNDDGWSHGKKSDDFTTSNNDNLWFTLYGDGKTITLDGTKDVKRKYGTQEETTVKTAPMLFSNIMGKIYDLTIDLKENIISEPSKNPEGTKYNAEDAIAPLAYSLYGEEALLSNVRIISSKGKQVESATPSGLVVWALKGAKIENCIVDVPVKMWMPSDVGTQSRHYAGGIVACAGIASIEQCQYQQAQGLSNATVSATGGNFYYGGIVGGTVVKSIAGYNESPCLALKDNSSWYETATKDNTSRGSIIGYAAYAKSDGSSTVVSGMAEGNEGNWWNEDSRGAGTVASLSTEVLSIGRRNSVTPTKR